MAQLATQSDVVATAGYTPSPVPWVSGSEPSVTADGVPVLVTVAQWAPQTPIGGGTVIDPKVSAGSATVTAGGKPVVLSTSSLIPPASVLTIVPPRTVEAF